MTSDEAQGTLGRRKMRGEALSRTFPLPAFLCAEIFIEGDDVRHKTLVRHFSERLTCDQQVLLPFFL